MGQRGYSGSFQKRKPDDLVADIDRTPRGKKQGNKQEEFDKLLHKQCPMHPKFKHLLFECVTLRKSLNAPIPDRNTKKKDKEDDKEDKSSV
jgi:hypothetical protein